MKTPEKIYYSDGREVASPVVQIWADLHSERANMFRAYWCSGPDATSGSPIIGYCSAGGSAPSVSAAAREVWRLYPDARIYRESRELDPRTGGRSILPTLRAIQRRAQRVTASRGHRMQWTLYPGGVETVARPFGTGRCRDCGRWVQIETRPPANGIDIGGDAVAESCTRETS